MPQPTIRQVHTNRPLTNLSTAYIQQASHFVAGRIFSPVPVDKKTDQYYTWPKDAWFRDEVKVRGDVDESAGSGMTLSTDS